MHIKSIDIKNFRRFESWHCELDPRLTLLIGPNGAGKTSLLRAIHVSLDAPMRAAQQVNQWSIEDVRRVDTIDPSNEKWRTPVLPSHVLVDAECEGSRIWMGTEQQPNGSIPWITQGDHATDTSIGMNFFQTKAQKWFDPARTGAIPLFARFGASHSWSGSARAGAIEKPFESKQQILQKFRNDSVDIGGLAQWFQYNELRTLQERQQPLVYRLTKEAVLTAIHAEDVSYIVRDNQLMVKHADQGWRPFEQLSDGQRRIAAIFCELAMRCASLNSQLGEDCIRETVGIVTIDELDLHLHPTWQRSIIADLRRVFPKLQFVVASHSPFLLQAAFEHGRVLDVTTGEFIEPGDPSIEDIAETVMGVEQPQRSVKFLEMKRLAQEYLELLERSTHTAEDVDALKVRLDHALAPFANDPAAAAWLEQRRVAAGL